MALQIPIKIHQFAFLPLESKEFRRSSNHTRVSSIEGCVFVSPTNSQCLSLSRKQQQKQKQKLSSSSFRRSSKLRASDEDEDEDEDGAPSLMTAEERYEWRSKIRHVMATTNPPDDDDDDPEEVEDDLVEKRRKMQKLLADYPLVVDEEDPDWPEDADGRGFNLDQFFNKITIKNVNKKKNNDDDDDDEDEENDNELVWQDDDYIRAIKDITTSEWEEAVFKDISPLILLLHHRYKRPKENEKFRDELEKAVQIIWNCSLPSPRCVAVDAVVEVDLVSALKVSVFPEMIFTKAGKILYREKAHRTADELSKIMAFFYYGASKPPCLNGVANFQEAIPSVPVNSQS